MSIGLVKDFANAMVLLKDNSFENIRNLKDTK